MITCLIPLRQNVIDDSLHLNSRIDNNFLCDRAGDDCVDDGSFEVGHVRRIRGGILGSPSIGCQMW